MNTFEKVSQLYYRSLRRRQWTELAVVTNVHFWEGLREIPRSAAERAKERREENSLGRDARNDRA
jgi:hypothetical protein